ncbi:HPP family protein [Halopenitus sp. H-Gu1]|uniref:CBS domain-containing protein n=1 Tax=Halopenitus sp. H-Gu1 TaxID=3242697 RepID=UPI00359DF967
MQARDLMVEDVKTVSPDDDVSHVLKRFARVDFSGFPVVDEDGVILGIVTESDLVDLFEPEEETLWIPIGLPPFVDTLTYQIDVPWSEIETGIDFVRESGRSISEVMTRDVLTVTPETDVEEVLDHLVGDPDVNRIPVVDDDGKVVGIIARQDVIRAFRDQELA